MADEKSQTRPITVWISDELKQELEREARDAGRSGVSAHIRWILERRRISTDA